jgi:Domain of unknown function (DUF4382)
MNRTRFPHPLLSVLATTALLTACGGGGGGGSSATGTLRLSLTDAPACGYDSVFVTVEKVRVHMSGTASDTDSGWSEVVLATPKRIDLLALTNGALETLGQTALPAGTYTQMRLVLSANSAATPMANAITPHGGVETALTTPSGQQSGLKMNVNIDVPADKIADFAIDFDACKSFVKAGNSGKYLMKPVLSVIPMLSDAGQRIVGYVDTTPAGTTVSAQLNGLSVRATAPDLNGKFVLYPVPAGNYDLVITAAGRVNAVMTGVPVVTTAFTTIGSDTARVSPPAAAASAPSGIATGTVTANASKDNTGGEVRATQTFNGVGGPMIEVGYSAANATGGVYSMTLPTDAAAKAAYVAGATTFSFSADATTAGKYKLEAKATGFAAKMADITLSGTVTTDFVFP